MSDRPLVSVGLPVFNGDRFLDETISSILNQDIESLELIISDNGSTDNTCSIIRQRSKQDDRVRAVFNDKNRGAAWNFNNVLRMARGKYFHWSGYDDLMDAHMLRRCIDALRHEEKAILAYPRTRIIDEHGILVKEYDNGMHLTQADAASRLRQYLRNIGLVNPIFGVFPTEEIRAVDGIGVFPSADLVTLARVAIRGQVVEIPELLFSRRIHDQQSWRKVGLQEGFAEWLDPSRKKWIVFADWRLFGELLRACFKEDLSLSQRFRCIGAVLYGLPRRRWRSLIRDPMRIMQRFRDSAS